MIKIDKQWSTPRFFITQLFLVILLITAFEKTALAEEQITSLEITKSRRSETLGDIYTFGLYSPLTNSRNFNIYAGVQFMFLDDNDLGGNDSAIKLLIGQELAGSIAPFYEIGTDLFGFITLFDDSTQTHSCREEQQCSIDFFFRIGLRIKFADTISLGIFHENIDFGHFHENVSGEHRYVGSSLAIAF